MKKAVKQFSSTRVLAFVIGLLTPLLSVAKPIVLNNNAGWCWYQDERVIVHNGKLFFASVASILGTDGKNRSGNIEVGSYHLSGQSAPTISQMHDGLEDDDHNVPALLALPDNNVLAVYSKHNTDRMVRYRITSSPNQPNNWQNEVALKRKDKVTYANLMRLSNENNGKGRIYNFYRGINFNPTFDTSDDNGKTWSKGTHFITNKGRPYVKYISNDKDKIHFVTTEQHPRVFDNSIYHGYIKNGDVFKTDGTFIQHINDGPFEPTALTKVYQGGKDNVAWTTDLHIDENGHPFTVFSVQMNDSTKNRWQGEMHGDDMRYYLAKWVEPSWWQLGQKAKWQVNEIAYAGSRLYNKEQDYTGLAALNPQNANEMVISTNADPTTGEPLISKADGKRHWELFKGTSTDNGKSFTWAALTQNSSEDNLRPVIPVNKENDNMYLTWMRGKYVSYIEIDTQLMLAINPKPISMLDSSL
ncbi:BNR-4 repeat-containing protein [Thalassotalea sp. PLHSN55]|uniref:BNR-4 repeat-containing protein n=1 Tax=Thalassotalea sp. PLHSN55 TaxID=3435888 RepID=UPI003F83E281